MSQPSSKVINRANATTAFESDRYNFNIKLYLDVNHVKDSTIYQAHAVLDPLGSYYHFHISHQDQAFMNLFFDLMKIECRSLTDELRKHYNPSKALIDEVYDRHIELFSNRSQLFLHEVNRGRNTRRMKHWNKHIEEALGVDNMALYPSEVEQD